jgi:hypothetical protein
MEQKKFIEHRPNYVTGFENKEYFVKTFQEVLEIPFVKRFSENEKFYSYAVDVDTKPGYRLTLMAMYDWNDEYNGCNEWWVVGYLPGFIMYETELKQWTNIKSGHKPNCWTRKYKSCEDMLGNGRDDIIKMKMLKELGWGKDDIYGIANHCDCGFDLKRK